MTVVETTAVSRRVTDGVGFASDENHKPAFTEPGIVGVFTCTVTGV